MSEFSEAEKIVQTLIEKLYGKKHCDHCNKLVDVKTYEQAGSQFSKLADDGVTVTMGFVGAQVCSECFRTVE